MYNKSFKKSHKMGLWKVSAIIALAVLMLSSGLMIAKLNAKAGVAEASVGVRSTSSYGLDIGGSTNGGIGGEVDTDTDYTYLANKYYNLFVQNPNGTVTLDLSLSGTSGMGITGSTVIDDIDRSALNEYAKFLDNVNAQIENGAMYIGDDGNYYFNSIGNNDQSRSVIGGKNEAYIRTEKFWFVWLPVGWHIELNAWGSIMLGIISGVAAWGGAKMILQGADKFLVGFTAGLSLTLSTAALAFLADNLDDIFTIVYGIFVGGMAAITVASALTGGAASILGFILNILGTYIFWTIGADFLAKGIVIALGTNDNTVAADTNLVLQNRSFWTYRY